MGSCKDRMRNGVKSGLMGISEVASSLHSEVQVSSCNAYVALTTRPFLKAPTLFPATKSNSFPRSYSLAVHDELLCFTSNFISFLCISFK
jgi:hypothetical protein